MIVNIILILCSITSPSLLALAWYLRRKEQRENITIKKITTQELVRGINLDIRS